jgi:acetoacetyl-CoA synthetase
MNNLLWQPSETAKQDTQMYAFMQGLSARLGLDFSDYPALYAWSIAEPAAFWEAVADFVGIDWRVRPAKSVSGLLRPFGPRNDGRWFEGGRLNYAAHLLKNPDDSLALIAYDEQGEQQRFTRAALHQRVACAQAHLIQLGLRSGDIVAAVLPNGPEAIIFMLATTALGAIWTSCSPDFGVPALVDRFSQVSPRFLVTTPGTQYKGRWIDAEAKNQALKEALPSLTAVISTADALPAQAALHLESLPFDHPAFILYSSGTTGLPKCMVHGHGGTLIQHMKELILHTDLKAGDRLLYITTCGWMMWNWMVSALGTGATVVLYEGSPLYPQTDHLLSILSEAKITVFGTSAKFLSTWQKAGVKAQGTSALNSVRTILSTGSPLLPETFDYVYKYLKSDLCLSSISGGTDILSCFALGCPLLPVYQGELQCRGLGMAVEVWNKNGESVVEERGELVCVQAFPSMPLKFWNDPGDIKYRKAYFSQFGSVWTQGDYAMLKANGGLMIFGRSDAVLNPGGVRIGTAEIYRQVESLPAIAESLAVGLQLKDEQIILLFVILAPQVLLTDDLINEIKQRLRQNASPRHVPAQIIAVQDFPRTYNGKVSEMAVTKILHGQPLDNAQALINPESLDFFRSWRETHIINGNISSAGT